MYLKLGMFGLQPRIFSLPRENVISRHLPVQHFHYHCRKGAQRQLSLCLWFILVRYRRSWAIAKAIFRLSLLGSCCAQGWGAWLQGRGVLTCDPYLPCWMDVLTLCCASARNLWVSVVMWHESWCLTCCCCLCLPEEVTILPWKSFSSAALGICCTDLCLFQYSCFEALRWWGRCSQQNL